MYRVEVDLFGKQNGAEFIDTAEFPGFDTRTQALEAFELLCSRVSGWVGSGRFDRAMLTMYDEETNEEMRYRTYIHNEDE